MTPAISRGTLPAAIYTSDFKALQAASNGASSSWLSPIRERAWAKFSELGFPTARRGNERWKYTNLAPLARTGFTLARTDPAKAPDEGHLQALAPWDDAWTTLVFLDGRFINRLSRPGSPDAVAVDLAAGIRARRDLVEAHITSVQAIDEEHFTLLNTAFIEDGALVHIPDGGSPPPVHLLFLASDAGRPQASHPRTLVVAGKNSRSTVIESYVSLNAGSQNFTNAVTEYSLDEGAQVSHYRVLMENENSFHIGNTRVCQSANSAFHSVAFATGQAIGRNDIHVRLDAEGAECNLTGLYMTNNRQHLDNNISVTHEKPHGTSHQYYKGILAGKSHAVFSGIVVVKPGAIKTYADQKDLNLLLSRGAEIDTKPSLEILADDVKCYHGATAGHVDQDTIYYMRSRGLDLETAKAMLIRGFAAEVAEQVSVPALSRYIAQVTDRLLPQFAVEGTG
jgi:Fe-S cluster assembly protein SufD